ncbi:MAG: IPT/TIG domain-containing protein [Patescibacteria group bacterium]|nr:IPT/TIG domain-containing protein [Patescibacteria group bacterium]
MKLRSFFAALAVITSLYIFGGNFISPVQAQIDTGLNAVGQTISLPDTDPRVIAARLINVFLGLLGVILLVIILYAGFLWMTAGGDAAKVEKAKAWLRNGIIGVIIVLLSWAIASFVINSLINAATGGSGGSGGGGSGGSGGGGFGTGGGDVFRVVAKSPEGSVGNADLIVRILFNKDVDEATFNALSISPQASGAWSLDPTNPQRVLFTPSDPCPGAPQKTCFVFDTEYTVTVTTDLRSTANQQLRCGGFYPDCTFTFTSGNTVDTQSPTVLIQNLYDGKSVPVNTAIEVVAKATDDIGISGMEWEEGGQIFNSDGPQTSPSPQSFEASGYWDTVGKTLKQSYTITVRGTDLDSNTGSKSVDVVVLAEHCFDTVQNNDETGIDCGGADCLACSSSACQTNSQCASGLCINNVCVEQPIITDVQPLAGAEGTYVSIWGDNFGDTGTVTFMGPPEVTASAPQACVAAGAVTWSNHYALVEVPSGAGTGPIRLLNGNSNLSDQTDDALGPEFTFTVNNDQIPGLCGATPKDGAPGVQVSLDGTNFGSTAGTINFGNGNVASQNWSNSSVNFLAPVLNAGLYPVWIKHSSGAESNKVPFTIKSTSAPQAPPVITYLDPANGPRGQFITIVGDRFGHIPGVVRFYDKAADKTYTGDAAFSQGCSEGWWKNNNIVIKVPSVDTNVVKPAQFAVYIERSDNQGSNQVDFTYTDGVAGPGICTLNPNSGPAGSYVEVHGENLGQASPGNQIVFSNGQIADIQSWQPTQIDVSVPNQAITGPIFATVSGQDSNAMQFAVADCRDNAGICDPGQTCCPNGTCSNGVCQSASFSALYSWQFSTGIVPKTPRVVEFCDTSGSGTQLPSPTPWVNQSGGDQVCINPVPRIGVLFDIAINWPPTQSPGTLFSLNKCIGTGADPCDQLEDVAITAPDMILNGSPYVSFEPVNQLDPDTTYYVFVSKEIRSEDLLYGTTMDENTSCPEPGLGYCYRFRTRSDTGPCQVGDVYVNPPQAYVEGNEEQNFEALPATKDAVCNIMKCDGFDFNWSVDPLTKAWVKNSLTPSACKQTIVAGDAEATNPPVKVRAEEDQSKITGFADLYIQYIAPRVVDKFPNCDTACSNIYIWAQMNTSLWSSPPPAGQNSVEIPDPIKPGDYYKNVKVYRCATENCFPEGLLEIPVKVTLEETSPLVQYQNKPFSFIQIEPIQDLARGTYYKVWLNGGAGNAITSKNGTPMPQSEEWQFRTRLDNEICKPDAVNVYPSKKIEERVGDRELFTAKVLSPADDCRADGQMLKTTQSFEWKFDDNTQQVASFVLQPIDTGAELPHGCSNNCLANGSDGVFGQIARCGNGIIETTDDKYCVGGVTLAGQPCVILPSASGAGEQCDGGGLCDPGTCLWKPVPENTCGNGTIDYTNGEMCDPGVRCFDVTSTTLSGLEGTLCNTQQVFDDCNDAGGLCEIRTYNGCTDGCKNLGASSVPGTTCGNGDIAEGEDCDLGNQNGTGGCTNNCLHRGSSPSVASVCGNGVIEPGENCDAPAPGAQIPVWCDTTRCIKLGSASCADPSFPNCCGNNVIDDGEECDDNKIGGDGCSAKCLLEGSAWQYENPSFCGNGILETGELCESIMQTTGVIVSGATAGIGDGKIDPKQLAIIDPGLGTPDPDTKVLSTPLSCSYDQITGNAIYGVGCGKTDESQCEDGDGLDNNGCCAPRPAFDSTKPPFPQNDNNGQGFCRNVLIEANFTTPMNVQSVVGNFTIAKEIQGNDCPDGTEPLAMAPKQDGFWGWLASKWQSLVSWVTGEPAMAVYCTQTVPGTLVAKGTSTTAFVYRLSAPLDPNTNYIVRFNADPDLGSSSDNGIKDGIRTNSGVVGFADAGGEISSNNSWEYSWWFKTGNDICRVNTIEIEDLGPPDPAQDYSEFYFQKAFEEHLFVASAKSVQNGQAQSISPIPGFYNWLWQPWVVNNPEIAQTNDDQTSYTQEVTQSGIRVSDKSGYAWVFASLKITEDSLGNGNTKGSLVSASVPITVFICDNPWPLRDSTTDRFEPFRDADQTIVTNPNELWLKDLYDTLYTTYPTGPFFNFQTMYCRDHENGVLPTLRPSLIPLSATDAASGILRQYLLTFDVPAFKSDGIGIRVYRNPYMDTPLEWYRRQGFTGNPQTFEIDGYPAVRDGGTVYIGFPNTTGRKESIYPNILVMSHNVGASVVTEQIFDQLLSNYAFNINFDFDNGNVCVKGGETGVSSGEIHLDSTTGAPVTCVSDWDCLKIDNAPDNKLRCASFKYKLQHDIQRLADFKQIDRAMEQYYSQNQKYPVISEGTFQKSRSNSRWPSWQETLGKELGITMPVDPVNRLITCGLCKPSDNPAAQSTVPCATDTDCNEGHFCESQEGYDTQTCWNAESLQFKCPYMTADGSQPQSTYDPYGADEPFAPSRFYKYRALDGGRRYELSANFEISPINFVKDQNGLPLYTEKWWSPAYEVQLKYCVTDNLISNNRWCSKDSDCKPCLNPSDPACTETAPVNSCKPAGFRYQFKNICNNDVVGESGICGDGVKGLVCAGGANQYNTCTVDADCPGSTCDAQEFCELGETKIQTCDYTAPGMKDGYMLTVCEDCQRFVEDPILTKCLPKKQCGNGRLDGYCGGNAQGDACSSDADCAGGVTCDIQETCDDGVLNGSYGHCNTSCTGYDKYCGDGQLSPNEACDNGSDPALGNGAYCANTAACYATKIPLSQTCGLGCTGKAPYCGDGKTNGPEQCDGEVTRTISAICSDGPKKETPCSTDEDCGVIPNTSNYYTCGPNSTMIGKIASHYVSCENITRTACATDARVCLTASEIDSLEIGNLFPSNPNIASTYQTCQTNAGCTGGRECISLSGGLHCLSDAQCSTANSLGICRNYGTEHVRNCQDPGTANQCKWENTWSACKVAHFCGDGVLDPGEECDDGLDNANNLACLPTCKLNVCGDDHTFTNVEECDNGVNNGVATCKPEYGSTCNDCSLQCKNVAKAGGYCGNDIKDPGEQCDGNISVDVIDYNEVDHLLGKDITATDSNATAIKSYIGNVCDNPPCQVMADGAVETDLTCKQLGYDFSLNSQLNRAIEVDWTKADWTGLSGYIPTSFVDTGVNFWYEEPQNVNEVGVDGFFKLVDDFEKNILLNKILWDCGILGDNGGSSLYWKPQNEWPSKDAFYQCVNQIGSIWGFKTVYNSNNKPVCSADCKPSGCGRCSDEVGNGEIHGYIMDRVWLQPVPTARVSLQYRGVVVDQKMTDENGRFEFKNLSSRGECDQYKLTIDKFDNNICTELSSARPVDGCLPDISHEFNMTVDEGKNGGYWSFTTEEFSVESYPWQEMLGMIFIYPRPAKGEGYISYGRPTLIDSEGWIRLQECKDNPNTPGCQDRIINLWFPWDKKWAPHIIWPENQARLFPWKSSGLNNYYTPSPGNTLWPYVYDLCSYENRGTADVHPESAGQTMTCARDYNWMNQGNFANLGTPPYTGLICPTLKWDRSKVDNCPLIGVNACIDACVNGEGAWRILNEWLKVNVQSNCQAACNPTGNCSQVPLVQPMDLARCHLEVNNAQVTGFFRYADPVDLTKPLQDLDKPIELYFSGPDYEPIKGENFYTAPIQQDSVLDAWVAGTKPTIYSSLQEYPDKILSWREYWAKTKTKVYITTDKGMYNVQSAAGVSTRSDFQRPFWHIASISPLGTVTINNKWQDVYDLGFETSSLIMNITNNLKQPATADDYRLHSSANRPSGMACWNNFGAACTYQATNPWKNICAADFTSPGGKVWGILNNVAQDANQTPFSNQTIYQNACSQLWNIYSGNTISATYLTSPGNYTDWIKRYAQINW